MPRRSFAASLAVSIAVCLLQPAPSAAAPVVPEFDAGNFEPGAPIDNTYFPLVPGTVYRYQVEVTDDEGETVLERIEEFVTFEAIQIAGVTARGRAGARVRGRAARRGYARLLRAGQGRQRLVPRRGHGRDRVRRRGQRDRQGLRRIVGVRG